MSFIDGLSSGLDTSSIISQLIQIERRPQLMLSSRRRQEESARASLSDIRSDVNSIRTQASDLRLTSGWDKVTATSSNEDAVSVQADSSSSSGALTFNVTAKATAASVYTTQQYASTDSTVAAAGASVFNASGYESLGFSALSGNGLGVGAVSFSVTQSSQAAEVEGVGIPAIPIDIDATNDSVDLEVNGFSFSVSLSHGTYTTETALADALKGAIADSPDASSRIQATLTDTNTIKLSTLNEGSVHSVGVTGGSALSALGLSAGASATGVDGIVNVDGIATTISDTTSGTQISAAAAGGGSIDATIAGPIREGTATVTQQDFGGGTLAEVVSTINGSNLGYTASSVATGSGYRLQLTATETGANSAFTPDTAIFGTTQFSTLSAGTDAQLTVEGDNPFTITSPTNNFNNLVPGVSITVNSLTSEPVTVSSERDTNATTQAVSELVDALNSVIDKIGNATRPNPGGPRSVLQGYRVARQAADQLRDAMVDAVGDEAAGSFGLELTREGTLQLDEDKFRDALVDNPDAVSDLFADRTGTGTEGILDRLVRVADDAASTTTGYLFTAAQAAERRIDDYGRQIDSYERRLEVREVGLRRTFANLEVALSGLSQQSGYLAAQLGSLGGLSQ